MTGVFEVASYDRLPRPKVGDKDPTRLFASVGFALTHWERLESSLGELFDVMVSWLPRNQSNGAAHSVYCAVTTAEARIEMLRASAKCALKEYPSLLQNVTQLINTAQHFRARRNDIAHGRVIISARIGAYLIPNNVSNQAWAKDGAAKYEWSSSEVRYYADRYAELETECMSIVNTILEMISAVRTAGA
jgi:hypothetical protein